jgi:hypothetical protein
MRTFTPRPRRQDQEGNRVMLTTKQLSFAASVNGGKWHVDSFGVAECDSRIEIDRINHLGTIVSFANVDASTIHPICCRRCIRQNSKEHTSDQHQ